MSQPNYPYQSHPPTGTYAQPSPFRGEPHRGALILVLGILSIVLCAILGPIAWILGKSDLAKIDAGRMDPEGRGITTAGMICGIVGTVFLVLGLLASCVYFALFIMMLGAAAR